MSIGEHKDVVIRFIKEVWNESNFNELDNLIDPSYYDYSYQPHNREGLEHTLLMMQAAFSGHKTIIEDIVSEGDTVAICQTLRGMHSGPFRGLPASGKQIEIGGYRFFKVRDGKITSHRALLDLPSLLQQINTND